MSETVQAAASGKKKGRAGRVFVISLAILVLMSILNWGVVSGWGNVHIEEVALIGDNGSTYTGLMYIPSNATNDTPAPALLTIMGASGNARNHEVYAVEYARRGFIVLSVDNAGSGDATYDTSVEDTFRINVPELFWNYLMECPIVDKERTVVSGHSIGSTGSLHLAARHNPTVCVPIDGYMGVYPSSDELYYTGMVCAVTGDSDAQNTDERLTPLADLFRLDERVTIDGEFEYNTVYGSFEDGSAKAVYMVPSGHEDAMINTTGMQVQLDFVQQAMEVPNPIDGSDQVWMWKDVFGLLGMFAFAVTLAALAVFLIQDSAFFASIKQPMPRNIGLRGKGLAISVVCSLVFPLIVLKTGCFGLTDLLATGDVELFSMGRANRAFTVVIGLSILGLLTFILFLFTDGKKQKATLCDYGVTTAGNNKLDFVLIGKSLLLAVVVLFVGFAYLRLQRQVLGTDFYCLYFGYKPIAWNKFIYMVPYIIVWIVCFIMAAVGMNIERRLPSTGSEGKDLAIALAVNIVLAIVTITVVLFVQYYIQTKILYRTATAMADWSADLTRLWGMPAGITVGTFCNTYLYRKTGNIWPGVFLGGTLAALGCVLYGGHGLYS